MRNDMSNRRVLFYLLASTIAGLLVMEIKQRFVQTDPGCGSRDFACEQAYDAADDATKKR